ncbi:MAG: tetraacyldisaccharide 4'-kinase [Flavobacteriaceae bacterium]|nr:tetraacyldisaccharide 4'-kinase [Flavobacteriaceae bacterium]MDG1962259.1 tetraacyldisaccharide 4'-kinase [Flavobacteriaceae bacterium]
MNIKMLLLPFSLAYHGVTALRNLAFDRGVLKSHKFKTPVISVGNLSVGGTGKTPMIEYLVRLLQKDYQLTIISRGYGRKTKGFLEVTPQHGAHEVGDEPLQFKKKFPKLRVVVCADRVEAINAVEGRCDVILLDDAFQHRYVRPTINILLTTQENPYHNDMILPVGWLRESASGAKRADLVVVSKCAKGTSYAALQQLQLDLKLTQDQSIYFSDINYGAVLIGRNEQMALEALIGAKFTLVTGIANPEPLAAFLEALGCSFDHLKYPDHHDFTPTQCQEINARDLVITTEKDFQRLTNRIDKSALYFLPVETQFLFDRAAAFAEEINNRITYHRKF